MTMDCQAKPPRKPHRPQRRVKNPDGTLRAVRDRTDLAAVQAVYAERAQVETRRKMAEFRAATPNGNRILIYSQQTHTATQRMLADLQAQIMTMEHLAQTQRREMEATIAALADRVARLEG